MADILSYFPKHLKPRDGQVLALKQIAEVWDKSDVIVITLPTAFGKSAIAKTIMDWQGRAAYITPTNQLVKQFQESYEKVPVIYNKELYCCSERGYTNCEARAKAYALVKKQKSKYCNGCPYVTDNKKMMNPYRKQSNTTTYMYIARQLHQPILIADEAHTLINVLSDYHSVKIRHKHFKYPLSRGFINRQELLHWLTSIKNIDAVITDPARGQKGLKTLYNELINDNSQYLIKEQAASDGDRYLQLIPLDFTGLYNPLWGGKKVNKIILMSATISPKDVEALGLSNRRVSYINADSPIPADNRPYTLVTGPSLNKNNLADSLPTIMSDIAGILNVHTEEKGLVHTTYQMATMIREYVINNNVDGRFNRLLFHDKNNKAEVFELFKASDVGEGLVLVASGMYEGVDLPYDASRFQIITKVPWPNLAEPAIRLKAKLDNAWYEWAALKDVLQAYGRVCRSPDDYGVTYQLDNSFKRLLDNPALPTWFKAAYKEI